MKVTQNGNVFSFIDDSTIIDKLPVGFYNLNLDAFGNIYLIKQSNPTFPDKIYSNDASFIEHTLKSFEKLDKGNLGIALVGEKGLGKSFTANLIATAVNLPVIKLTSNPGHSMIIDFFNSIEQDFVLLIDEFEKVFENSEANEGKGLNQVNFLSFLDSGTVRNNKMLFIITSNSDYKVSDFLKGRPSRLRYYKNYEHLSDNIITEIVKDRLIHTEHKEDLIEHLPYPELNIDVLIKIIDEINVHNVPYSSFKEFFNFKPDEKVLYKFYIKSEGQPDLTISNNKYINHISYGQHVGSTRIDDKVINLYSSDDYYPNKNEPTEIQAYYTKGGETIYVSIWAEPVDLLRISKELVL